MISYGKCEERIVSSICGDWQQVGGAAVNIMDMDHGDGSVA